MKLKSIYNFIAYSKIKKNSNKKYRDKISQEKKIEGDVLKFCRGQRKTQGREMKDEGKKKMDTNDKPP